MSPARKAIMTLIRTAEARNYSSSYKEALRAALSALDRAEADANTSSVPGPAVIYQRRPGDPEPPIVRWDEVVSQ